MRRPPLSPDLVPLLRPHHRASRRGVLAGFSGAAALTALGGCGTDGTQQTEATCVSTDTSATDKKLQFSNWPQYLDVDGKRRPTLEAFERKSGVVVTYTEDINDNDQFFGKIQAQLAACRPTGRDIIVLTSWLAGRLVSLGWAQALDKTRMPNVEANLLDSLRGRAADPNGTHAVPWQGGLAGLAYNGRVTKEIRTVDELLTRPDLKGKVTLLTELRDTMGLMLQSNGHDPAGFTEAQFDDALAKLKKAVDAGQIRRFTGNDYAPDLAKGDIAACAAWSGDVIQLAAEDDKVRFVVPESGILLYSDDMLVPNQAAHKGSAEALMDYYYDPVVAARLAAYVNYICPVKGAQEAMEKIDPALAENPLIFPDEPTLAKAAEFMPLTEAQARAYNQKFQAVIGGDLRLTGVTKRFGPVTAVDDLHLTVPGGSFFALLGPSGCGKTTTLRMIAGLDEPTAGEIRIDGDDITPLRPYRRPVNTVFQSYALFPHLDVTENVAFGLRRRKQKEIGPQVERMLALVQLEGLGRRRPAQLSGGQQQRVALARALINRPRVLLLDEPLGALDLALRRRMQLELKRIQTEVGITFVHVTHDQEEAMSMADTVAVMNAGRIEQLGPPAELYDLPATPFVATFLGQSNLVAGEVAGRCGDDLAVTAHGHRFTVPAARSRARTGTVLLGVRPEKLHLAPADDQVPDGHQHVTGVVSDRSYVGVSSQYLVRTGWGAELIVFAPSTGASPLPLGAEVVAHWDPRYAFLLDRASDGDRP